MAAHWLPIGLKRILLQNSKPRRTRQSSWNFGSATHSLEVSKKTDVLRTWCSMSWIMLCQPYKTMAWTIQDERTNLRSPWIPFLPKKRAQEACLNPVQNNQGDMITHCYLRQRIYHIKHNSNRKCIRETIKMTSATIFLKLHDSEHVQAAFWKCPWCVQSSATSSSHKVESLSCLDILHRFHCNNS